MLNTVIFDMDGLLLDTEPIWGRCMLSVAQKHGIDITPKKFKETTGLRITEVTDFWSIKYPWSGSSAEDVAEEIVDAVIETSKREGCIMAGVENALQTLDANGFKIGLASSSPARMIDALITHFDIKKYFRSVVSADISVYGKPHPGVFLECAQQLKSSVLDCVVFEDSFNGIIAGKAARMRVIAVPDPVHFHNPKFACADLVLETMKDFRLDCLQEISF